MNFPHRAGMKKKKKSVLWFVPEDVSRGLLVRWKEKPATD